MNKYLRNLAIAVALAFAVAVILTPGHKSGPQRVNSRPAAEAMATKSPTVPPNSLNRNRRLPPPNEESATQTQTAETDPDMIGTKEALRAYRNAFGENPIGSNAEITKALAGGNSRQARFTDPELKIRKGELVDRWQHPLFFHQLSRTEMEIRSAGPDGVMFNRDDEIIR